MPVKYDTLRGHKLAIEALCFSHSGKYLVSIGDFHDKGLIVWDMERRLKVTANKLSKQVSYVSFAHDNSFFVTAGKDHLKFWYFDAEGFPILSQVAEDTSSQTSESKASIYAMENKEIHEATLAKIED